MCVRVVVCHGRRSSGADRSGPGRRRGDGRQRRTAASGLRRLVSGDSQAHGLRAARHLWQSGRRASLDFAAAIRRLAIRCDLAPQDLILFTREGADAARRLKRRNQARRDAASMLLVDGRSARTRDRSRRHRRDSNEGGRVRSLPGVRRPRRRGGRARALLYERTSVQRIRAGRKAVTIKTDTGLLTADAVVIATGAPIDDLRALRRHLLARETYMVLTETLPAAVRRQAGARAASLMDAPATSASSFPHLLRWMKDDRVLFAGADKPRHHRAPVRRR